MSLLDKKLARQYDNASTQINVPPEIAAEIMRIGKEMIPDAHLAGDGRVELLHITIKYGVQPDQRVLQQAIAGYKSFKVALGKTVIFPDNEGDSIPVVVEVHGHEFEALHEAVAAAMGTLPDDFPYTPHITVAYVQSKEAQHYAGKDSFVGIEFDAEAVTLSMFDDDNQVDVALKTGAAKFYHGTNEVLAPGTVLKPSGEPSAFREREEFLEDNRPEGNLPRSKSVFMTDNPHDAVMWGDHVYEVRPVGPVERNKIDLFERLVYIDEPEWIDEDEEKGIDVVGQARKDAEQYWAGSSGGSGEGGMGWEYRAPEAKIVSQVKMAAGSGMPSFQVWLKSVGGVGGFLGESDANLVFEEDFRDVAGDDESDTAFIAYITDRLEDEYNVLARRFRRFKWPLPIYRSVTLDSIDDFDSSGAGLFWTWNIDAPEAYWGEHGRQSAIVLKAFAKPSDVDWKTTITKNLHPSRGEDEAEVTVKSGARLQLAGYCTEKDFWGGNREWTPLPGAKTVTASALPPIKFAPPPDAPRDYVLVKVNTKKLDEEWSKDAGFYLPAETDENRIGIRYERFQSWLYMNPNTPIEAPIVSWKGFAPEGGVGFTNGRHRFAVLRDMGYPYVSVMVPKTQIEMFRSSKFAASPAQITPEIPEVAPQLPQQEQFEEEEVQRDEPATEEPKQKPKKKQPKPKLLQPKQPKKEAPKKAPVETTNFKKWFGKSQVRDDEGKPLRVYHGTTHNFDVFDPSKGEKESHYGKALYFTSSKADVGENYATDASPDLNVRIENSAERIFADMQQEWDDEHPDEDFPEYSSDAYQVMKAEATAKAKEQIAGQTQGVTMPVYLSLQNPVVVKKNGGTMFDLDIDEDGNESGNGGDLYNAMMRVGLDYDGDVQRAWGTIMDNSGGSFNAWDFEKAVRESDYIEDSEGSLAAGNFIADVYQEMGFDGIIQYAYEAFGPKALPGGYKSKGMKMEPDTKHYILWDPTKVKSAIGNPGKFDPKNPSITAAKSKVKVAANKIALNVPRLVKDFGQKFLSRVQQDRSAPAAYHAPVEGEEQIQQQATALINRISAVDPSPNKEYTAWIVGNYARGGINRWEDIQARIIPALKKFDKLKLTKKLPLEERDIMKVKGIEGLENLMEKYREVEAISEGEKERDIEKGFFQNGEAELIHDDAQIKIIHPKTQKAACYFGINTRWCTAATEGRNYFEHYNKKGPLYIVLIKADNKRYQLHFQDDTYMDEKDRPISTWDLTDNYPVLKKIFQPVVLGLMRNVANIRASFVAFVENPDANMMLKAVDEDPSVIDHFPNAPEEVKWRAFCRRLGFAEVSFDSQLQGFVVAEYKNVEDFAEDRGDDTAKWAAKISSGGESLDYGGSGFEMNAVLEACAEATIGEINTYIQFNHDKELKQWLNDNDQTFPLGVKAIEQFISENDAGEMEDKLRSGWYSGEEAGAQDEIVGAFKSAVMGLVSGGTDYGTSIIVDQKNFWDSPVKEILPLADAQRLVEDSPDSEDIWENADRYRDTEILKVKQPYYGFSGFSDEACNERVSEEFYISEKEYEEKGLKKKRKKQPVASLLKKGVGEKSVGNLGLAKRIMHELMPILGVQLPEPELKIVDSPRAGWLGRDTWSRGARKEPFQPWWGDTTTIELQKSILNDENTLRRIVAHELAHHADALVNGVEEMKKVHDMWTFKHAFDGDGHGASWRQWAQKFNAKFGANFVTKTSDETYVTEELELKPYHILLKREYDGRLAYEAASRITEKMKRYLDRRASDKDGTEYRLTQTNDRDFFEGQLIGSFYWSRPKEADRQAKLEELWNKGQKVLPSGAAKEQDDIVKKFREYESQRTSSLSKMAEGGDEVVWEYAQAMKDPKKNKNYRQKWSVVPAARLKKIWTDYANLGFVRDEAGMRRIAEQVLDNIWKLQTNTILTGHSSESPSRYGSDILGQDLPEDYFEQLDSFFEDDNGAWRISDYGLDPLLGVAFKLEGEDNAEQQLQLVDRALQVTHARSDLASWFVEGGSSTLSQLFRGMELTELEKARKQGAVPQLQELPHGVSKDYDRVRWVYQQFLNNRIQSMSWQDFQKQFPKERNSPLFTKVRQNRPKVTTDDMERWMDEFDAKAKEYQNYEIEHGTYQDKATSFRDVEQLVLKINQSASAREIIGEDPMLTEFLGQIAQGSAQSGHPAGENTVGWLRVDFIDDDWLLVDEVQSDLINAMELGKKFLAEPTLDSLMSKYKSETVKQKIRDMGVSEQSFQMSKREMLRRGYTPEKLDEMKQQLANLFKDWAEYGIASLIEIARRHGIKNIAIHTGETIARRDPDLEADKAGMYYDQLAKSFGFQKQQLDVGDLKGPFWVRTASKVPKVLYHGTYTAYLPHILKEGLKQQPKNKTFDRSKSYVYLTDSPLVAEQWAYTGENPPGGDMTQTEVVSVDVSKLDKKRLHIDDNLTLPDECPDCGEDVVAGQDCSNCGHSFEAAPAWQYDGDIPPSAIKIASKTAGKRSEAGTSMTVGTTDPNFPMPLLIRWEQGMRWRQVLKSVKAIVGEIAGRRVPWREIHIWASFWDDYETQQEGWEKEKAKGTRVMYDVLHDGSFVSVGQQTAAPLGAEVIEASHKTPPLSDTRYNSPEIGEETNAYADIPERVRGTYDVPPLKTLAPQMFEKESAVDLKSQLVALRPQMAAAAQKIYDEWEQNEDSGGGICDEIEREVGGIIASSIEAEVTEGGQDGDDHAWTIAYRGKEAYGIDIPSTLYERGGGYSWTKVPGVTFSADDVEIFPLDIDPSEFAKESALLQKKGVYGEAQNQVQHTDHEAVGMTKTLKSNPFAEELEALSQSLGQAAPEINPSLPSSGRNERMPGAKGEDLLKNQTKMNKASVEDYGVSREGDVLIAYHGTRPANIPGILSNGIVPDESKKGKSYYGSWAADSLDEALRYGRILARNGFDAKKNEDTYPPDAEIAVAVIRLTESGLKDIGGVWKTENPIPPEAIVRFDIYDVNGKKLRSVPNPKYKTAKRVLGQAYLLHFADANHYLGWAEDAQKRIQQHYEGSGAKIAQTLGYKGTFTVARIWDDADENFGNGLKQGKLSRWCPICHAEKSAAGAVNIDWKKSMFEHYKLTAEFSWHEAGDKTDEDQEIGEANWNMLVVNAFDTTKKQQGLPGKWVGSADFVLRGGRLESSNTEVNDQYWRQGIATALYQYAEGLTGFQVKPHLTQSDAGRALWQQKNRPFGRE